jgi:photosystem II stability/assembly factor-like uncharacterized protein
MKNHRTRINPGQIPAELLNFSKCMFLIVILGYGCDNSRQRMVPASNPNGRNDSWGFTGFGGGGATFNPAVSPHDADYACVACDMTGSFVTYNGGKSWRMFSLRGPVSYFVFDPSDPEIIYANSIALFKSNDRGNTWNILYPGAAEINGVVSKGDHAEETVITKDSSRRQVLALAVDPDNSMNLYAAISVNNIVSLYLSYDKGDHWTAGKELEKAVRNIYIDPSSPKKDRTLYITGKNSVTIREKGIWKINAGPENVSVINEFSGGYDKKGNKFIIYAISGKSYFNPAGDQSGIFFSEDGGRTWHNRQYDLVKLQPENTPFPEWRCIAACSSHPEVVYVSYNGLKQDNDTSCIGVARSEDFGKTWKLVWKDRMTSKGSVFSGNYKKGWIDDRFGPSWGENPFSIGVAPANPDVCYTTDFGRTIKTSDGGASWEQVYTNKKETGGWISRGLEVTTGYCVVFDPFNMDHVFIANTDIGLMESRDSGESWMSATMNNGIPDKWVNTTYWLAFDPVIKGKCWAVMSYVHDLPRPKMWRRTGVQDYQGGILMTENGGKNWKPVSNGIGEAAFTHILIDPTSSADSRTLYACAFGKGVFKSEDGGKTWAMKNKGIESRESFAWRIIRSDKTGTLYLIICRRSEDGSIGNMNDGAVYYSDDDADSWNKMVLPEGTNGPVSMLVDPEDPDRLILSAWGRVTPGRFSPDTGGGIFLSADRGKTWKQVLEKDQHIHDLTFDARTHTCFACGFGGSAYRSDDRGETWERLKGYNFKWGKRVDPDPRDPGMVFIVTFGGGVWHGPAGGDPNAPEDILTPALAY